MAGVKGKSGWKRIDEESVRVTFWIPKRLIRMIEREALERKGATRSEIARKALLEWFKIRSKKLTEEEKEIVDMELKKEQAEREDKTSLMEELYVKTKEKVKFANKMYKDRVSLTYILEYLNTWMKHLLYIQQNSKLNLSGCLEILTVEIVKYSKENSFRESEII
jgi:metal-responsive CopG/Arc/MetJ family transcriptional regulator